MSRSGGRRSRVLPVGFLAALAATFVAISPALADTQLSRYGKTGVGTVNEAQGDVVCNYDDATSELTLIEIAAPNVFARDRTSAVDHQRVGYRVIVKRGGSNGARTYRSSVHKALASDNTAAMFGPETFSPGQIGLASGTYWSVFIKMLWYKADGRTVVGWSKHRVDYLTLRSPAVGEAYPINGGACQSFLP